MQQSIHILFYNVVSCLVVRHGLLPEAVGAAGGADEPHRGAGELLQAGGGVQAPFPGRQQQQDLSAGPTYIRGENMGAALNAGRHKRKLHS